MMFVSLRRSEGVGLSEEETNLGGSSNHVLDEIAMSRGIDDGDAVLGGLEAPEGDVDGDPRVSLLLELVHDPGVLEGALSSCLRVSVKLIQCETLRWERQKDGIKRGGKIKKRRERDTLAMSLALMPPHL